LANFKFGTLVFTKRGRVMRGFSRIVAAMLAADLSLASLADDGNDYLKLYLIVLP
jgi:hypothetical protein